MNYKIEVFNRGEVVDTFKEFNSEEAERKFEKAGYEEADYEEV